MRFTAGKTLIGTARSFVGSKSPDTGRWSDSGEALLQRTGPYFHVHSQDTAWAPSSKWQRTMPRSMPE